MAGTRAEGRGRAPSFGSFTLIALMAVTWFAFVAAVMLLGRYNIPSGSMTPSVLRGDYVLVSKVAYGISRYSLPLGEANPFLVPGRVWAAEPKRGEIVVFKLKDGRTDYIKRVVGLPGDTIQVIDGVLTINGEPVKRQRIADWDTKDALGQRIKAPQYTETLPGGVEHRIVEIDGDHGFWDNTERYVVPAGHVFMLGDNRDNSTDSRDLTSIGYVPLDNLVGRALMVFFSIDGDPSDADALEKGAPVRWSRMFTMVH